MAIMIPKNVKEAIKTVSEWVDQNDCSIVISGLGYTIHSPAERSVENTTLSERCDKVSEFLSRNPTVWFSAAELRKNGLSPMAARALVKEGRAYRRQSAGAQDYFMARQKIEA